MNEIYPNGGGFRPEIEDVWPVSEEVEEVSDEDTTDEYRENLTELSDLNNPANFAN